jgi:hypothetical protein
LQGKVQLLSTYRQIYLIAFSRSISHVFAPPKAAYRRAIIDTLEFTLLAPALERRFISIYNNLRVQCLGIGGLEAGWF